MSTFAGNTHFAFDKPNTTFMLFKCRVSKKMKWNYKSVCVCTTTLTTTTATAAAAATIS